MQAIIPDKNPCKMITYGRSELQVNYKLSNHFPDYTRTHCKTCC